MRGNEAFGNVGGLLVEDDAVPTAELPVGEGELTVRRRALVEARQALREVAETDYGARSHDGDNAAFGQAR